MVWGSHRKLVLFRRDGAEDDVRIGVGRTNDSEQRIPLRNDNQQ